MRVNKIIGLFVTILSFFILGHSNALSAEQSTEKFYFSFGRVVFDDYLNGSESELIDSIAGKNLTFEMGDVNISINNNQASSLFKLPIGAYVAQIGKSSLSKIGKLTNFYLYCTETYSHFFFNTSFKDKGKGTGNLYVISSNKKVVDSIKVIRNFSRKINGFGNSVYIQKTYDYFDTHEKELKDFFESDFWDKPDITYPELKKYLKEKFEFDVYSIEGTNSKPLILVDCQEKAVISGWGRRIMAIYINKNDFQVKLNETLLQAFVSNGELYYVTTSWLPYSGFISNNLYRLRNNKLELIVAYAGFSN